MRGGVDIESERRRGVTCRVALITAVYPTEQGPSPSPPLVLPSPSPCPCPCKPLLLVPTPDPAPAPAPAPVPATLVLSTYKRGPMAGVCVEDKGLSAWALGDGSAANRKGLATTIGSPERKNETKMDSVCEYMYAYVGCESERI